jgi:hypothetical protein
MTHLGLVLWHGQQAAHLVGGVGWPLWLVLLGGQLVQDLGGDGGVDWIEAGQQGGVVAVAGEDAP